jgi:hypothetical protein
MVHALEEARRVLRSGGVLIDVRPVVSQPLVEVLGSEGVSTAGRIDDSADLDDGIASDKALAHTLEQGWLQAQEHDSFHFAYYWDTPDEMFEYIAEKWTEAVVPDEVFSQARALTSAAAPPVQLRIQIAMTITRYQKLEV